jgi:hypothetical protein
MNRRVSKKLRKLAVFNSKSAYEASRRYKHYKKKYKSLTKTERTEMKLSKIIDSKIDTN